METAIKAALAATHNDENFIVVSMDKDGGMLASHKGNAQQIKKMIDLMHDSIL